MLALSTGSVTLDLQVGGVDLSSLASPVTVPVTFSGTAVKGSEYSVSAEQFILGGNSQSLSITVTALDNYDEAKEIVATLGSVADFIPGYHVSQHSLDDSGRVGGVVVGHVLGKLLNVESLLNYGACIPETFQPVSYTHLFRLRIWDYP